MNTNNTMTTNETPEMQWEKPVLYTENWMNTLAKTVAGSEGAATTFPDHES